MIWEQVRADFPCAAESAGAARQFVGEQCARVGSSEQVCEDALLLTSEVVTNAIEHGRSEIHLAFTGDQHGVRVEVADDNSRMPVQRSDDPDALDGRGMVLVQALAHRWGVKQVLVGKIVWFDVED